MYVNVNEYEQLKTFVQVISPELKRKKAEHLKRFKVDIITSELVFITITFTVGLIFN